MGGSEHPIGSSRIPNHEKRLLQLRAILTPFEKVIGLERLSVFINAEKAHVEIVSRIFEVVWISAKEGDALFWSHNQAEVGVSAIEIQIITRALVERDDLRLQSSQILRFFF